MFYDLALAPWEAVLGSTVSVPTLEGSVTVEWPRATSGGEMRLVQLVAVGRDARAAASVGVRGLPDRSHPDVARIEQSARSRLGDAGFSEAAREGTRTSWSQLVAVTLAS